ncbi:MAG: hypothetical protein R6V47_00535 [Candidatus Delongbacteria bacterium]
MGSIKSEFVKEKIKGLLAKISESKKIFRPFRIDFYIRKKHNYSLTGHKDMTISELLDSLSENIEKARILRINKLDLNGDDGKKLALTDNSFKDLEKEPEFREKAEILKIIEETALASNKKSSLEWIWGRSPEDDAYYSTKLTYFDDRFSLYPEYRFYVGIDPLRDKNGWFYSLAEHNVQEPHAIAIAERGDDQDNVPPDPQNKAVIHAENIGRGLEDFDCGSSSYADINYRADIVIYEKNTDGRLSSTLQKTDIEDLLKSVYDRPEKVKYIRLKGTDFSFRGEEVRKSESETVIKISGDIQLCSNRIKSFLSEGMTDADKKRSAEFITGSNSDKLSYNAAVITVYDGQTSYFPDYKIYASSEVRKDKNSWFSNL